MKFLSLQWLSLSLAAFLVVACGDDQKPNNNKDTDDTETEELDSETNDEEETDQEENWEGVSIETAIAPDEYTVTVKFGGNPPAQDTGDVSLYSFTSNVGDLEIESCEYDSETKTATLTTNRQKLGVTYTVEVLPDDIDTLTADFISADTAVLWVVDFASAGYSKYEIETTREAVGEHGVIYLEEGSFAFGAEAALAHFDDHTYPIENDLFTTPPDMDGNGKIVILGLNSYGYYGGYFDPTNAYPDSMTVEQWGIHSNEMEIIHIAVDSGAFDEDHTVVPHEYQHLLNEKQHPFSEWTYHNEGMSECAVLAVNGSYAQAMGYYFWDYTGNIGEGQISIVDWGYADYDYYATAFMFWSYIAGQLDGADTFSDIFHLSSGSPNAANQFMENELGLSFGEVQMNSIVAAWLKDEEGVYSFNDILDLPDQIAPHMPSTATSVNLKPFAGTIFLVDQDEVDYSGTQGEHIIYAGFDSDGGVDTEEPFDTSGGAMATYNSHFEYDSFIPEPSGPYMSPIVKYENELLDKPAPKIPATWRNPPPFNPNHPEPFFRWKARTEARLTAQ